MDLGARCFAIAAERGDNDARFCLAMCHRHGNGVPVDPELEARYLKMAADEGHATIWPTATATGRGSRATSP